MNTAPTLFKSFIDVLKVTPTISELREDVKRIQYALYEMDKRLVRVETFFEMMKMQKKSLHLE